MWKVVKAWENKSGVGIIEGIGTKGLLKRRPGNPETATFSPRLSLSK